MDSINQQIIIDTLQYQSKLLEEMDLKINYLKQEVDTTRWNISHLFGVCNEIKTFLINKMD